MNDKMPLPSRFAEAVGQAALWLRSRRSLLLTTSILIMASSAGAQMAAEGADKAADKETEPGIPVTEPLVREKCGTCHTPDDKGNLSRISWVRTTPEGWAQVIHRMVRLNGLQITPEEAKSVVRSLAASHGLSPGEAQPVMYLTEHRIQDETNIPNETVRAACAACHAFAQPLSWRRSAHEWKLLQDMHVALYAQAETQYRRRVDEHGIGRPQATDGPTPGQVALDYMRKTAPLRTADWESWHARMRPAQLDGTWLISASVPGRGRFVGKMVISPGKGEQEFASDITLHSLADGSVLTRKGSGVMYNGYSWRGTSMAGAVGTGPDALDNAMRETMWFAPDQKTAMGRWFWGFYQEFGVDVKLTRASSEPTILSVAPYAIKVGAQGSQLHILGSNLPTNLAPRDISLGNGVTLAKIVSSTPDELVVDVNVAANAPVGLHDVAVKSAVLESALPVYRNVDYIKVTPENAISHLGGSEKHPKGYQQFEAIGFDKGPDGKPGTADDVPLGPVDVTWSIGEFPSVFNDDDKNFVGTINAATGLFTPNIDGPNPQRRFGRNNYGDVWATATAKTAKDANGKPLTGKAYLIVSVPAYKRWDQPEVDQ
jgi:quinohemoprotein amine dehydrogenase